MTDKVGPNSLSSSISLLDQSSNDSACCVVLIQRVTKFLSNLLVLLLQRESFEHQAIPFVLEYSE